MKKIIVSIVFSFFVTSLHAQEVIKSIDTEKFPEVSFTVHSDNPENLTKEKIRVMEEGVNDSILSISPLQPEKSELNANVLFLWDLRSRESFVPELLHDFFHRMEENEAYKFNVALFRRDGDGNKLFEPLLKSFTSSFEEIKDSLVKAAGKGMKQESPSSDIIWAMDQAIDQVCAQSHNEAKAIILLTSGKNNMDSGFDISSLITKARKGHVLIYVVNIAGGEMGATLSEGLSIPTYGLSLYSEGSFATKEKRAAETENSGVSYPFFFEENEIIKSWVESIPIRSEGISYRVTFISHYDRIDQTKPIVVELGDESFQGSYHVPSITFGQWIKAHWLLFAIVVVLSLAGLGFGLFYLIRYLRDLADDKREKKEYNEAERKRLKSEQESLKRKIEIAENEQKRRQEQETEKAKYQKRQEYLSAMRNLMKSKNIKLRLLVSSMTGSFEYIIDEPETTIGTAEDNDVVLDDITVSRHHALIYFHGETFGIKDLRSTNGVVMNGFKVEDLKLRNGDTVSLGKTILKIYY